jgi:hypothetical protein
MTIRHAVAASRNPHLRGIDFAQGQRAAGSLQSFRLIQTKDLR